MHFVGKDGSEPCLQHKRLIVLVELIFNCNLQKYYDIIYREISQRWVETDTREAVVTLTSEIYFYFYL